MTRTFQAKQRSMAIIGAVALACLSSNAVLAQNAFIDRPVIEVIDEFRQDGWNVVYSTNLITADLTVQSEPESTEPVDVIREILAPYELTVEQQGATYLVVRMPGNQRDSKLQVNIQRLSQDAGGRVSIRLTGPERRSISIEGGVAEFNELPPGEYVVTAEAILYQAHQETVTLRPGMRIQLQMQLVPDAPRMEQITVNASRYDVAGDGQYTTAYFGRAEIENMSDLGGDPLRVVHRLPGTASGDYSAKSYVRGGNTNEMSIVLDGLELVDPFHTRDFQALFSSINQRAVSSIQMYSGGYPAKYGDSLTGLMLIEPRSADGELLHEVGVSLFSTSALSSGTFREGNADWLIALRRGNLDLLLDRNIGKPSYNDAYAHLGLDLSPKTYLSINGLASEDDILIISENDGNDQENATSNTSNQLFWIKLDNQWTDVLSSETLVSSAHFSNIRAGIVMDPREIQGQVSDRRALNLFGIKQDWELDLTDNQLLSWGADLRRMKTDYDYSSTQTLFGFFSEFRGVNPSTLRDIHVSPSGESYSVYFSDKFSFGDRIVADVGVRWDKQTYSSAGVGDDQLSPRLSILYRIGPVTDFRASWGRYHQAQDILGLQVEDGIQEFFPAQLAEHSIISVEHRFSSDITLRVEAYRRTMGGLQPRYENLFESFALLPELQPDRTLITPESASAQGLEFLVSRDSDSAMNWWATYSRARVDDTIAGNQVPRSWDQRHSVTGGITWQRQQWTVSPSVSFHTGWPVTTLSRSQIVDANGATSFEIVPGPRNTDRVSSFKRIDMRATRRFDIEIGSLEAFLEVTNLLDRENPCCVDYDLEVASDGSEFLERSVKFWMPRVASVGVLWEF